MDQIVPSARLRSLDVFCVEQRAGPGSSQLRPQTSSIPASAKEPSRSEAGEVWDAFARYYRKRSRCSATKIQPGVFKVLSGNGAPKLPKIYESQAVGVSIDDS